MAPVVLVLALLAPALSLPFATLEHTPGTQVEQQTPVINIEPQTQSGIQEKTGVPVSTGCSAGYSAPLKQGNVAQQVPTVQETPVPHAEPLFLPPQTLAVAQAEQTVRPVIVPAEAIASGRVIVMAIDPIQQRAFPDVIIVPQQQSVIPETIIQQVEPVEKQTAYQGNYSPVPSDPNVQQNVQQNFGEVPQRQTQVRPESTQHQVYPEQAVEKQVVQSETQVQPVQEQVVQQVEYVEKQGQPSGDYTPVKTTGQVQTVEPVQRVHQEQYLQSTVEKQQQQQQLESVQQTEPAPQQQVYTAQVPHNVQKQVECPPEQSQTEPKQRVNVQETPEQVQQSQVEVQQQTYSVQPEQVAPQTQSVEPQQKVQAEAYHPVTATESQQAHYEPQQVSNFASGQIYNFGDKIPQQRPVETVFHQQQYLVQPVVVENQ